MRMEVVGETGGGDEVIHRKTMSIGSWTWTPRAEGGRRRCLKTNGELRPALPFSASFIMMSLRRQIH